MIKVKARAKRKSLADLITLPLEGYLMVVGVVVATIVLAMAFVMIGVKSHNLVQENRWLREKIEKVRIEVKHLRAELSGVLSSYEVMDLDGE